MRESTECNRSKPVCLTIFLCNHLILFINNLVQNDNVCILFNRALTERIFEDFIQQSIVTAKKKENQRYYYMPNMSVYENLHMK